MMNRHLVRACAFGFGVVLLAACGGSSTKSPAAAGGSSAPSASSPVSTPSASAASLPQLQKIVLQAADLPAGWKGTPHKADLSAAADQAAMTKCVGVRNTDSDKVAEAHSENFALGNASISASASSYKSQSDLDDDITMFRSPKLPPCFEKLMKKELATTMPASAKIDSVSIKITPGSAGGPDNVVATGAGTINVSLSGQKVQLYLTFASITGPLSEVQVETFNVGTPVLTPLVKSVVAAVAARAAKG